MTPNRFWIERLERSLPSSVTLPSYFIQQHGLRVGSPIELWVGATPLQGILHASASHANRLALSNDLAGKISLSRRRRLWLRLAQGKRIQLSSVLAILVAEPVRSSGAIFGPASDYLRYICSNSPRYGLWTYLVTAQKLLQGLQSEASAVRGTWSWSARKGSWIRLEHPMPLPEVIYDRIGTRAADQSETVGKLREFAKRHYGQRYFNPGFFDKWRVHELLSNKPTLQRHLPATHRSTEQAWRLHASRWKVFYIKPVDGSQGMGIARFTRLRRNVWSYYWIRPQNVKRARVYGIRSLIQLKRDYFPEDSYIVQRGISLAEIHGRPFDLRILLQKGSRGRWRTASSVARVAARSRGLTNLSRGAEAMSWGRAFQESGLVSESIGSRAVRARARNLAMRVARALEEELGTALGELGVDLALDQSGHLWLLEVNAKPGHIMPNGPNNSYRSAPHLMRYCLHLTGCERIHRRRGKP